MADLELVDAADPQMLLLQMFNEIKSHRSRIKKRFEMLKTPTSFEECKGQIQLLAREMDNTVMSYLQDTAHYLGQHVVQMESLWDRIDTGDTDTTQFTPEDATRFERVLGYAKTNIEGIIGSTEVSITPEQRQLLVTLLDDANFCLSCLGENTLEEVDDDDEENDDDEEDEKEEATGGVSPEAQ